MKKAVMQEHRNQYVSLMGQANASLEAGLYRDAVSTAMATFDHVDGMMRYERKYSQADFQSVDSIDLVLRGSPFLLDLDSINMVESMLKNHRLIDKNTSTNLAKKVGKARSLLWHAHALFDLFERHGEFLERDVAKRLRINESTCTKILDEWEVMGLLLRQDHEDTYMSSLSTRMGAIVSGKCPLCGAITDAPKAIFLERTQCPDCSKTVMFNLISKQNKTSKE